MPEECLMHADMVCIGEGEEALLEVVKNLSGSAKLGLAIKNICVKVDNKLLKMIYVISKKI